MLVARQSVGRYLPTVHPSHTLEAGEEARCIFVPEAWEVDMTTLPAPGTSSSLSLSFLGESQPTYLPTLECLAADASGFKRAHLTIVAVIPSFMASSVSVS